MFSRDPLLLRLSLICCVKPLLRFCNLTLTLLCCRSFAWLCPRMPDWDCGGWLLLDGFCRILTRRTPPYPGVEYAPVARTRSSLCVALSKWAVWPSLAPFLGFLPEPIVSPIRLFIIVFCTLEVVLPAALFFEGWPVLLSLLLSYVMSPRVF